MITFEEVTQTVLNLVKTIEDLKQENAMLKAALKNVREPDNKKEAGKE